MEALEESVLKSRGKVYEVVTEVLPRGGGGRSCWKAGEEMRWRQYCWVVVWMWQYCQMVREKEAEKPLRSTRR